MAPGAVRRKPGQPRPRGCRLASSGSARRRAL